jgi:hypothetical protein
MSDKYILIGQTAVPCADLMEWGWAMESMDRRVGRTYVGPYEVSTVFPRVRPQLRKECSSDPV